MYIYYQDVIMYHKEILIIFITFVLANVMACPLSCGCIWKGGKQTVECINKSMNNIPNEMDIGTQVLEFSGNNLKSLPADTFKNLGLVHLQKIFLSRCRITHIDDRAFQGLSNLVELDLSHNIITAVPTATFHDYPSLMKLNLNGNHLHAIKSSAFSSLQSLISLELSKCQIDIIENNAFAGLNSLEWLKLDHNSLKYIPGPHTLPKGLHGASLQRNPWFCDCFLIDIYNWLNGTNIPEASEPTCDGPQRLRGAPIKLLDENELACLPDITPSSLFLEIAEDKNVSLLCKVHAIPEAEVSWRFQNRILQNDSIITPEVHLYYVEEGKIDKKSELFIFNTKVADNGTFACVAENQAGRFQSNYTIRIIFKEETNLKARRLTFETTLIVCVVSLVFVTSIVICFVTCLLRCRIKKKRKIQKNKNKELAFYGNQNIRACCSSYDRQMELGCGLVSADMKSNGDIRNCGVTSCTKIGNVSSFLEYPSYMMGASSEQNPDLISDTEKERSNSQSGDEAVTPISTISSSIDKEERFDAGPDTVNNRGNNLLLVKNVCESMPDKHGYNPVTMTIPQRQENARGWISGSETNQTPSLAPLIVCFNPEVHVTAEKFIASPDSYYPVDYGLTSSITIPNSNFYRTLPHKRHTTQNNIPSAMRYVKEAEFLVQPLQPPSYEHYRDRINDIRYNVQGYPITDAAHLQTYTPRVTFSDTVEVLGKRDYMPLETANFNINKGTQVESSNLQQTPETLSLITTSAQTTTEDLPILSNVNYRINASNKIANSNKFPDLQSRQQVRLSTLSDSPDEGYVGECTEASDV